MLNQDDAQMINLKLNLRLKHLNSSIFEKDKKSQCNVTSATIHQRIFKEQHKYCLMIDNSNNTEESCLHNHKQQGSNSNGTFDLNIVVRSQTADRDMTTTCASLEISK